MLNKLVIVAKPPNANVSSDHYQVRMHTIIHPRFYQRAKKVLSDSPGLADFAIGLVNSVINLPDGQVNFFEEFNLQKNFEISQLIKTFFGLVEMIFGLVNVSFSLPEWQAVKMTFLAPCFIQVYGTVISR